VPTPTRRIVVNERVCEGCGDCARVSNCLSVQPVQTEFGRKTQVHQSSCNVDGSCLDGDCPSFLTVETRGARRRDVRERQAPVVPDPPSLATRPVQLRIVGVGGTGVVTVSQVLGVAAMVEGLHSWGLDMTGLSQKGGAVVSDVWISETPVLRSNRSAREGVDVLIACDAVTGASDVHLASLAPGSAAVVNSEPAPTADEVVGRQRTVPDHELVARIAQAAGPSRAWSLPASSLAEALFGDHLLGNVLLLGAAFQHGLLPVGEESLRQAVTANGVAVERNLQALAWGRALAHRPQLVDEVLAPTAPTDAVVAPARYVARVQQVAAGWDHLAAPLHRRVDDLVGWGGHAAAAGYLDVLATVADRERQAGGDGRLTKSVVERLHALTAYKDEYEVARLHMLDAERAKLAAAFGPDARVSWHLHPPLLRACGLKRKLRLGPWFGPVLRLLAALRVLRGTPLDLFGYARVRRVERQLVADYRRQLLDLTASGQLDLALRVSELSSEVRGYEHIKLAAVVRFRTALAELVTA
jgi:indolepyruvate ferredoxin oxidoreductase